MATTVEAWLVLPAASSTVKVIVLLPALRGIEAAFQRAEVNQPRSDAVPEPPLLFVHVTRYKRKLSVAVPDKLMALLDDAVAGFWIAIFGGSLSIDLQRNRSACCMGELSSTAPSSAGAASSELPPHPTIVTQAAVCANRSAIRLN
jgi:hypothetical protein